MYANCSGPGFALHSDIVAPYLLKYGSEELQREYVPGMADGSVITAIAMTEPDAGSDLLGLRTRAERLDGGWSLSGSKTYITNGWLADMVVVVARTTPGRSSRGLSLFCVPRSAAGFERGSRLRKLGMHAQDTAELFFDDVRLPDSALLGQEGEGFRYLMQELPQERLLIACMAQASSEFMLEATRRHAAQRQAFGGPLLRIKPVEHALARVMADVVTGRALVDDCLARHARGDLDATLASIAKLQATEIQGRVADACLQLHGGAGYMRDHEVSPACAAPAGRRAERRPRGVAALWPRHHRLADLQGVRRRARPAHLRGCQRGDAGNHRPDTVKLEAALSVSDDSSPGWCWLPPVRLHG